MSALIIKSNSTRTKGPVLLRTLNKIHPALADKKVASKMLV
jgi:hypothetical protein